MHEEGFQWIGTASIGIAASGIGLAFLLYGLRMRLLPEGIRRMCAPIYRIVANKYYVDEIYEALLVGPMIRLARRAFSWDGKVIDAAVNQAGVGGLALSRFKGRVDQVVVDGAGNGVGETVMGIGTFVRFLQTGLVQNYLLIACCGAIICAWVMK